MTDFDSVINTRFDELSHQMSEFKESLSFFSAQFDSLSNNQNLLNNVMKCLKKENESLRSDLNTLSSRLCQIDQLSRATNLELQCVPEFRSENVINIVKQIGVVVNMKVEDKEIHYCSRVAKLNSSGERPRNILVKFDTPRTRDSYLAAVIKYNKNHQNDKLNSSHLGIASDRKVPIYVTENLTPENKSLHAATRMRA